MGLLYPKKGCCRRCTIGFSYHLQKLIASLVTLPGAFILFFLIAALFIKRAKVFLTISALLLYLCSTYYIGNKLVTILERPYNVPLKETKVNGVVVLGGGHYKGSQNLPLEEGSFKRLMYGIMVARKFDLPIIFTGTTFEIEAVQESIRELNNNLALHLERSSSGKITPHFSIIYTGNTLTTRENADKTTQLFKTQHITAPKIYLVTSATHMRRAKALFEKQGVQVIPAATDFKTRSDFNYRFLYPSEGGLRLTNIALHEMLGSLRDYLKEI